MKTHPSTRTRALYDWEQCDLEKREGVGPVFWPPKPFVSRFWFHYRGYFPLMKWVGTIPRVEIRNIQGAPYCQGRSLIVLTCEDHLNLTLIHELVHALGYGSHRNPHSRGFVLKYIEACAWRFGWDADELRLQARQWGLI